MQFSLRLSLSFLLCFLPNMPSFIDHIHLCLLGYLYDNAGQDDRFSSFLICTMHISNSCASVSELLLISNHIFCILIKLRSDQVLPLRNDLIPGNLLFPKQGLQ